MVKEIKENPVPPEAGQIIKPPVVVVLGHIDHGKTSLLLAIRQMEVPDEKPGGAITQHIGAYQVEKDGKKITFLDTPGHEAFSQMRSRGAKVADIALLVVDAAEGVKPQTKEAILNIKQAGLPLIVVLNKIDKPDADPEKVKRELAREDVVVESSGGRVPSVKVSAKTREGIDELLEMILLVAEMEKFPADFQKPAEGVVIESYHDNQRGPTSTLLLTDGVLKTGDIVGTISGWAKVKSLENFKKVTLEKAYAGDPVIVFGFNQVPKVGEEFKVFGSADDAESYLKAQEIKPLTEVLDIIEGQKVLNLIIKADVLGSLEAIIGVLGNLPQDKVVLHIIKSDVGNINETDLKLAKGHKVMVLGFRVKADNVAQKIAEREKIRIMNFEIIYDLVAEVRKFMEKILEPEQFRTQLGKMRVLAVFMAEKNRQIVGGRITEGSIKKGATLEVFGGEDLRGKGRIINLQRNKKDIDEVQKGDECGILFEGDVKIEEGNTLSAFIEERKKGEL